jgi:hypothetical protein
MHVTTPVPFINLMDAFKEAFCNAALKEADKQADRHFVTIFLAHVRVHSS